MEGVEEDKKCSFNTVLILSLKDKNKNVKSKSEAAKKSNSDKFLESLKEQFGITEDEDDTEDDRKTAQELVKLLEMLHKIIK